MRLEYVEALWLLLLIPIIAAVSYFGFVGARRRLTRIVGTYAQETFHETFVFRRFLLTFLFILTVTFLVIALGDPRWGEESIEDERRGLEIVYLMDVSNSMLAEDVEPNRISRSRDVARAVQSRLPDSYTAVVTFKGDAGIISPMTEDTAAFELAMDYLSGAMVTTPGTNVESGLDAAISLFPPGTGRRKVILLFSDGQELAGDVRRLVRNLLEKEITVLSVVAGTEGGSHIPLGTGGVLRDAGGNPVIAGINVVAMNEIASETTGRVFYLNAPGIVGDLIGTLEELSGEGRSVVFRVAETERFRLFVVLALLSLIGSLIVETRRWGGAS